MNDQTNPLIQRARMPGETFTLPSGGLFYDDSVLDPSVTNAEVHVYPMTTLDQIVMNTPDMLFSGKAVHEVFKRCIPQVIDPDMLLSKDVDFLLVCLRKVSYGNTIPLTFTHTCDNAKEHTYEVDITSFIHNSKKLDPTSFEKQFTVTLDNGQIVKLQPIRYRDFIKVLQDADRERNATPEEAKAIIVESLSNVILQVDEIDDKQQIKEWLEILAPMHIKQINDHLDDTMNWGTDFTHTITCKDCGETVTMTTPMNPLSFFM